MHAHAIRARRCVVYVAHDAAPRTGLACQNANKEAGTIMLHSDLALLEDAAFKAHVERYAQSQAAFFDDFTGARTGLDDSPGPSAAPVPISRRSSRRVESHKGEC